MGDPINNSLADKLSAIEDRQPPPSISAGTDWQVMFEAILEGTMAGYWDWYIQEDYEYMSPIFKKMFGYEEHEIPNNPEAWQVIIHPDDLPGVLEVFHAHVQSKGKVPYENVVRYYHKDGSIVWVFCRGKVIEWDDDDNPLRMVGSHVDVTELKQIQADLIEITDNLASSNKELGNFARIVSHDLREPLRSITGFLGLLENRYAEALGKEAKEFIEFAVSGATRMRSLIDGLLEYSRLGSKIQEPVPVSVGDVLQLVEGNLQIQLNESGGQLLFPADIPLVMAGNLQIEQILTNLISNALKFRSDEAPRVEITWRKVKDMCEISVSDNGIGFDEEFRERIFDVFQRLHSREEYEGTGIGLAICRKIVSHFGGEIWAQSTPGQGTDVIFTLPVVK